MKQHGDSITLLSVDKLDLNRITELVMESRNEGFNFLQRLTDEYAEGINRFDRSGESLYCALLDEQVIGICGLNRDPYLNDDETGRVRHLYVARNYRRNGVARRLIAAIIAQAVGRYQRLTLRTDNTTAAQFYQSLGFHPTTEIASSTHVMELRSKNQR